MRIASNATLALFLLAGTSSLALAQTRVDQTNPLAPKPQASDLGGGRILDANLAPGGNRINTQVKDLNATIRQNNNIITGQASAGRAFRGSLGYKATDQFGGSISDNNSFNFRRDAASGAAPTAGVRTTDALNYQFSLTTGARAGGVGSGDAAVLRQLAASTTAVRGGDISTGTSVSTPAPYSTLRSISQYESQSTRLPTLLGYQMNPNESSVLAVTASPLRGIAITPVSDTANGARGLVGFERVGGGVGDLSTVMGKKVVDGKLVDDTLADNAIASKNLSATPIDTRLVPSGTSYDRVILSLTQSIDQRFVVAPPPAKPVGSPTDPANPKEPGDPGAKPALPDPASPGWINQLDSLKSKLRRDAMLQPTEKSDDSKSTSAATKPGTPSDDARDLTGTDPLIAALRKSNVKLDELIAKAGPGASSSDAYTRRMQEGQTKLSEAKFFDSEAAFTMALVMRPNDPMARLGRGNAQLGAGLFVSAATNLRELFTDNPELISIKFGPELLPSAARAEQLAAELEATFSDPLALSGGDGGLLLAFLGRQYGDKEWITAGLKNLRERTPKSDPQATAFTELLTRVWAD